MWLFNSSIGRKFVMAFTGSCLVLFLLFHAAMNLALIFSEDAYNWICQMLGANWYAIVASFVLAFLILVHFVYAFWITWQNRKARGTEAYDVIERQEGVDWASKNMLVIGIIIIIGLLLHMSNFWFKMQFQEATGLQTGAFDPQNGAAYVKYLFTGIYDPSAIQEGYEFTPWANWTHPLYCLIYLVWLLFLWLHLTHGVWSAMQTFGLSNTKWLPRIKVIGNIVATIVVLMFAAVVCYFFGMWLGAQFA